MKSADVVAVVATYRRAGELARLLSSLQRSARALRAVVVVDNGDDPETRAAVEASPLTVEYLPQPRNLGCGGALALGEQAGLERFSATLTHFWILDDDAVIEPATLDLMLEAMDAAGADLAHPLVIDQHGGLGWFPGLLDREKFRAIKQARTPEEFVARCGAAPVPFSWTQGIALLVTRRAVAELGCHRTDFLVRGEDLEFSLRLTARFKGIYVPQARLQHLPPPAVAAHLPAEYGKHRVMLQNVAYIALRVPHGRCMVRTIPGNWWRFFRTWGWRPTVLKDALGAFIRGALLGKPAGYGMH